MSMSVHRNPCVIQECSQKEFHSYPRHCKQRRCPLTKEEMCAVWCVHTVEWNPEIKRMTLWFMWLHGQESPLLCGTKWGRHNSIHCMIPFKKATKRQNKLMWRRQGWLGWSRREPAGKLEKSRIFIWVWAAGAPTHVKLLCTIRLGCVYLKWHVNYASQNWLHWTQKMLYPGPIFVLGVHKNILLKSGEKANIVQPGLDHF